MTRTIISKVTAATVAFFISIVSSLGQNYPNGLSTDSARPDLDSIYIRDMRAKMERIRKEENRPTIALVLSGGGAKGAAHLGAKRIIDEVGIPIDMICGTSIGGLVGGMFALGYSADFVEHIMLHQDWSVTLTDKIDQQFIPYSVKEYRNTYLLSVPFHYRKEDFNRKIEEQMRYSRGHRQHLGLSAHTVDDSRVGSNTLMSSLPEGYAFGFNVNNLISSVTVGYQDSIAFKDLPIPFFCVAADLVSCKAKNWGSGHLQDALRSTMSIPGLFDPVKYEGMVLTDGGMRNNMPVDLAKAMGADVVIGIDLSDMNYNYSEVNNLADLMSQAVTLMGIDSIEKNRELCDIYIKPRLLGYDMLSFSREAIEAMIELGQEAAEEQREALEQLAHRTGRNWGWNATTQTVDLNSTPVVISGVQFSGLKPKEERIMLRRIDLEKGMIVNAEDVHAAMSTIQASGNFESVKYSLLGTEAPYALDFDCVKGPVHQFGIGFRADSKDKVALMLNLGLNSHKIFGGKLDLSAKIGRSSYADMRAYYASPWLPTVNFEIIAGKYDGDVLMPRKYNIKYNNIDTKLYFSNINWKRADLRIGLQHRYFSTRQDWVLNANHMYPILTDDRMKGVYTGAFADGLIYTFDDFDYPSKGIKMKLNYELDLFRAGDPDFKAIHKANYDFKSIIPLGAHLAVIPDIHLAVLFDLNELHPEAGHTYQASLAKSNYLGGFRSGQYISQQVPFCGLNDAYMAGDIMALLNLELRARIAKSLYFSCIGGVVKTDATIKDFSSTLEPTILGGALQLGYDTVLGPIKANVHWSDLRGWEGLISFGFDF